MSCNFGDDITNCPVCFEQYTETEEHVPRILPCYDTLCQKCVGKLLREKFLTCPECRVKHHAKKGVRSFQQNKYILTNIKKKTSLSSVGFKFRCKLCFGTINRKSKMRFNCYSIISVTVHNLWLSRF